MHKDLKQIIPLLVSAYGDRMWVKRLEPVDELILTILSQNTSDTNPRRAFQSLKGVFHDWDRIIKAGVKEVADSIRTGGLADVKARYIQNALHAIKQKTGGFDLYFLNDMGVNDARNWLTGLPGVGMKTASCVLLFSLKMPAFPVDTHVYRVGKRLGLIGSKVSANAAHLEMERITPHADIYKAHVLIIEHGRKTCKSQRPLCHACVLAKMCPSYKIFANK